MLKNISKQQISLKQANTKKQQQIINKAQNKHRKRKRSLLKANCGKGKRVERKKTIVYE